jgi:taurine dioxygenase
MTIGSNSAYRHIEVKPIAGALGAEIEGVDLSKPLSEDVFAEIQQALHERLVIFFRNQTITQDQQKAFGKRFGPLNKHPFVHPDRTGQQDPEVFEVRHEPGETYIFGEGWHMDHTWKEKPLMGGILYAKDVPPHGGDTLFCNLYLAYETLSDGMKTMLDGLRAVHAANPALYVGDPNIKMTPEQIDALRYTHPVIRTHPGTGRKLLFLHPFIVRHFEGWTIEESRPLIDFLCNHATRPEFTCRHTWQANDLGFWDNRAVMHNPINDYQGFRRVMHRVAVESTERPV